MSGMEAALASGLLKVAGDKLVSLIKSEFASITGVKKDLSDLQDIHGEITSWLSLVHINDKGDSEPRRDTRTRQQHSHLGSNFDK
ncbi:hypothetical protein PAHAL_8G059700 [Panicum hallii]|uniref:Rx N-terminal domain-containing protein n=1 Tax=Panicum hallii TaxID=206008 RepID=A0A2T8I7V1_9POAL|nr:hypothetical protein PAHAL_8G059700 [Panicum hallii]